MSEIRKAMKFWARFCMGVGCAVCTLALQAGCQSTSGGKYAARCHHYSQPLVADGMDGDGYEFVDFNNSERPQRPLQEGPAYKSYTVVRGDSYWTIARRFDIPMQDLLDANGAKKGDMLRPGQELQVPHCKDVPNHETYVVQRGDTLSVLAQQCGCNINELRTLNHLQGNTILVGQRLLLPLGRSVAPRSKAEENPIARDGEELYRVEHGDTLSGIAQAYGMTLRELMALNGLDQPNRIREGKMLRVKKGTPMTLTKIEMPSRPQEVVRPKVDVETSHSSAADDDLLDLFDDDDLFNSVKKD